MRRSQPGEASVGAGQRRVEAGTGIEAFPYLAPERDPGVRAAAPLLDKAAVTPDDGFVKLDDAKAAATFVKRCRKLRYWPRKE